MRTKSVGSRCIIILRHMLLTKTTTAQNEVALSYHKVRGLYFLAVVFVRSIGTHIIKKGEIYQKLKSLVVCEGRPDFYFLFKSCEINRSQGKLVK